MATGTVKGFEAAVGYGFIAPSDGSRALLVRRAAVERAGRRTLVAGERVGFDVSGDGGRIEAVNLRIIPPGGEVTRGGLLNRPSSPHLILSSAGREGS
jgi:cold shock protein